MVVAGPLEAREHHVFDDAEALQSFQIALAEQLTDAGWMLLVSDRERRVTTDRRSVARPGERRRPLTGKP